MTNDYSYLKYVTFLNYRYEKWGQSALTHSSDDNNSYSFDWIYLPVSGLSSARLPFFFDDSSSFFYHLHLQFILTQFQFINCTRYHISIGWLEFLILFLFFVFVALFLESICNNISYFLEDNRGIPMSKR